MNRSFRSVLVAAALCLTLHSPSWAQPAVAKVVEIDGPKMTYERKSATALAFPFMNTMVKDEYQTDASTVAALEFVTGGRVGINKGTRIEIVSESEIKEDGKPVVKRIKIKGGRVWAKMSKRKEPLEIETAGGVMGIKGTEFVIATEENGATSLNVLEGEVEVTPVGGGAPISAKAGTKVDIPYQQVPVVKQYDDPEALREEILNSGEWQDFQKAMDIVRTISSYSYIPGNIGLGTAGEAFYYAGTVSDFISNPEQAALDLAASYVPGGGYLGYIPRNSGPKKPDFPTNPMPANSMSVSGPPSFSWTAVEKARGYLLLLSREEQMSNLDWATKTTSTSVSYPTEGAPLPAGTYYWRVMGLDDEGKPMGKATQSVFVTEGWGAPPAPDPATPPVPDPSTTPAPTP